MLSIVPRISKFIPEALFTLFSVLTGGRDDCICILDSDLNENSIIKINVQKLIDSALMPRVRSLCLNKKSDTILVGTFGSEIYELKAKE